MKLGRFRGVGTLSEHPVRCGGNPVIIEQRADMHTGDGEKQLLNATPSLTSRSSEGVRIIGFPNAAIVSNRC
jgi:hypothetical protein